MVSIVPSVILLFLTANTINAQNSGVVQDLSPCPSGALVVKRNINGPPGKRNNWVGRVSLDRWNSLPHVELVITLETSAKFNLGDNNGQVVPINGGYKIIYNQPSSTISEVDFTVSGKPNRPFPSPTGVYLNGEDICNIAAVDETTTTTTTKAPNLGNKFNPAEGGCGRRQILHQGLVTHGFSTQEGEWPWHTALYLRKNFDSSTYICGGTLISSTTVVTAGHCLIEGGHTVTPDRITVKLGLHNRAVASAHTQEYPVFDVVLHEEFDSTTLKHDIALLKLAQRVAFTSYIQPICLWPQSSVNLDNVVGDSGIIVGWGLDETENLSDILKQGAMPVVTITTCLESNPSFFGSLLNEHNFCAGFRNGTSVCNGDSGGGMYFQLNNVYYLRGIVSLAVAQTNKAVCNPRHYAIFTDVAKHLNFISGSTSRKR